MTEGFSIGITARREATRNRGKLSHRKKEQERKSRETRRKQ